MPVCAHANSSQSNENELVQSKTMIPFICFFVVQQINLHSETTLIDTVCLAGYCYILMHVIYAKMKKNNCANQQGLFAFYGCGANL